jgi:hypothetical protein
VLKLHGVVVLFYHIDKFRRTFDKNGTGRGLKDQCWQLCVFGAEKILRISKMNAKLSNAV